MLKPALYTAAFTSLAALIAAYALDTAEWGTGNTNAQPWLTAALATAGTAALLALALGLWLGIKTARQR